MKEIAEFEDVIIATGGGTPCFFDNMEFMNAKGDTIYLKTSSETLFDYLKTAGQDRPLIANKTEKELLQFITKNLEKREPFYLKAKYIIDSRDMSDNLFDKLLI